MSSNSCFPATSHMTPMSRRLGAMLSRESLLRRRLLARHDPVAMAEAGCACADHRTQGLAVVLRALPPCGGLWRKALERLRIHLPWQITGQAPFACPFSRMPFFPASSLARGVSRSASVQGMAAETLRKRPFRLLPPSIRRLGSRGAHPKSRPQRQIGPIWYRSKKKLGDDPLRHQCLLAYVSDVGFLSTSNMPHGKSFTTGLMMASIDHSLWFHRSFNFEDWILIAMESPVSAGSRGFIRASMFTQDGTLIGSAAQEGLIRDIGRLGSGGV